MDTTMTTTVQPRGGQWLLGDQPGPVVTPESLSDEQRLIAKTAAEFAAGEVMSALPRLERKDWDVARQLLRRCGELGLIGVDVPDAYGGVGLDRVSALIVSQHLSRPASFAAAFGAQATLSIVPILAFGTAEQKRRYLPALVSGECVGAYALSESVSGSDALGARAVATRMPDGSFRLSGEKMWITNGGFADLFIVFAKVDGEHLTAFIVERAFGGVVSGREEHKMGLDGSSTTALVLSDVPVPAANVLGDVGKGHKVAFNVLNVGRFKLGAMCLGGARHVIGESARYAAHRKQFGQPIASFGAIRHKLGEMTARTFALESLLYRTAGLVEAHGQSAAGDGDRALVQALEEFAVEASIAKVLGTEVLEYVVDENVQVHGGNGFVRDYEAERHYRDARVNRIFEGTNEINRLLIPGRLLKRAASGDLPLMGAARALRDELMGPAVVEDAVGSDGLEAERRAVAGFRKTVLLVAGAAVERHGQALEHEQEVLLWLADLAIDTYASDSAVQRASAALASGQRGASAQCDAASVFVQGAALRLEAAARQALGALASGDALRVHLAALRRLLKVPPADTVSMRRRLADATVSAGACLFG